MGRLSIRAKTKNAIGKVVDQGRRIMRALDNTTVMNAIDNWKITEMLGEYYEDHGIAIILCLACALGVFLGVIILISMELVQRCRRKANAGAVSENSVPEDKKNE